MDHLPLPRSPLLPPISVPYRCTCPYDNSPMLTYPSRHGWQILYSPGGITYLFNSHKPSDAELEAFLQNYLYFGLLHETFARLPGWDQGEFIEEGDDREKRITTKCLGKWLCRLVDEMKVAEEEEEALEVEKLVVENLEGMEISGEESDVTADIPEVENSEGDTSETSETEQPWSQLLEMVNHTWKVSLNTKMRLEETVVDPRIWLSISILAETIDGAIQAVSEGAARGTTWRTPKNPPIGRFLIESMRDKGWCPFDCKCIDLTTRDTSVLYYLANLQPTRPDSDHSKCSDDRCVGMTINSATEYRTRHAREGCGGCGDFRGLLEGVLRVLGGQEIPLIQKSGKENGVSQFEIVEGSDSKHFVAISHVWAEGLGNPYSNTLPGCSIEWISQLVNSLPRHPQSEETDTALWIDTICVPIKPEGMRIRAMNRLRKSYLDATHVLVLDSYLYTQDSRALSPLEIWARVLCCSWSRRLWTFQEGRLARNLWYQFSDRAIQIEEIFVLMENKIPIQHLVTEMSITYRASNVVRALARGEGTAEMNEISEKFRPVPDVRDMRESLKARAVSVPSDEALCLFCNMNMNMELVTDLAPEERMPKFWSLVEKIPVGLVFSTAKEKLTQKGLRWAPSSFMGSLDTPHWYLEQRLEPRVDGFPTPDGLQIKLPGFFAHPDLLAHEGSFETLFDDWLPLQDTEGVWYFVEMLSNWNQDRTWDPEPPASLVILLAWSMDNERNRNENEDIFNFMPGIHAVVGTVWRHEDYGNILPVEPHKHAMLHRFSEAFQRYHSSIAECVEIFVRVELSLLKEVEAPKGEENEQGSDVGDTRFKKDEDQIPDTVKADEDDEKENSKVDREKRFSKDPRDERIAEEVSNVENDEIANQNEDEDEFLETLATFMLTQERRELCEAFANSYVLSNKEAREITLLYGINQGLTPEEAFKRFGAMARFQLQMRRRNRILKVPQTQEWVID